MTAHGNGVTENLGASSIRDALNVIFRRWVVVVTFFWGTVFTALVLVLFFTKPAYKAVGQLLVSPGREHIADVSLATAGTVKPQLDFNAEDQIARTIQMLSGRFLAEQTVRTMGPSVLYKDLAADHHGLLSRPRSATQRLEDAVGRFLASVGAEQVGKSSLVNITFTHEDPVIAAKTVNLLGVLYVKRHLDVQKNHSSDAVFQEQFKIVEQKLRDSEKRLELFKHRYGVTVSVKDEQQLAVKQMANSHDALNDTKKQQAEVTSRLAELDAQLQKTSRDSGEIGVMQIKLTTLEMQESELSNSVTAAHPSLRALRADIGELRGRLAKLSAQKLYGTTVSRDGNLYAILQEEVLRNEAQQKALKARAEADLKNLTEYEDRLLSLEQIAVTFNDLQQQTELDRENYARYVTKLEEARISDVMDAKNITSVRVVEAAEPPPSPVDSKKNVKIGIALFFGLTGGLVLVFFLHFINGRLETVEDVERGLGLPVLLSIPLSSDGASA